MAYLKTPLLFLVFNRPDTTRKVFDKIREAKPEVLFVAADGPRSHRENESELCEQVRATIDKGIDWPCEVHKLYRDKNLGCGKAVSQAITWFFQHVEEGIILEDDTLPDESFFDYCEQLLERYRDSPEVMMISGNNFRFKKNKIPDSYAFTKYSSIWGWATWRRAWAFYNYDIADWPVLKEQGFLQNIFSNQQEIIYWSEVFDKTYKGVEDTWDYQWYYTFLKHNGLAIEPARNLVMNIGFREDATHTKGTAADYLFGTLPTHKLVIERHPKKVKWDVAGDKITFVNRYLNGQRNSGNSISALLAKSILRIKAFLFPNVRFRIKERYLSIRNTVFSKLRSK